MDSGQTIERALAGLPVVKNRSSFRKFVRRTLDALKINYREPIVPGIALFGLNIFRDLRPGPHRYRSAYALEHALKLRPASVLDVGSGGGYHAQAFVAGGSRVTCIDYGTSIYATTSEVRSLEVKTVDFNTFEPSEKYDLAWASHVLEHQRNVGSFIEKLLACCADEGHVCITLPDPHRRLLGGHLTLWSPGLLAYNLVLCGVDLSDAVFVRGTAEFSIFFKPKRISLPASLTFDSGDLDALAKFLPQGLREGSDPGTIQYARYGRK